jgi:hypothetical protein
MKLGRLVIVPVAALLLAVAFPAHAGDTDLLMGAGRLNLRNSEGIAYGSIEAMHLWGHARYWGIWGAADVSDSADWVGGGLFATWPFAPKWSLTISSGPGWYSEPSKLKLGSSLEFRSTAYLIHRWSRYGAGLSVSHYSNAGTASHNPGTESVRLFFSVRLGKR